jgi:hypothetical protein
MKSRSRKLGLAAGVILVLLAGGILAVRRGPRWSSMVRDLAFARARRW